MKNFERSERVSYMVVSATFLKPIPPQHKERVRQLIQISLWLVSDHEHLEVRRKWETERDRLPIVKKINPVNIDKVKVEIDGQTFDVTCSSIKAEVIYELIRLQNSEGSDQFRKHSLLRCFDMLAEYLVVNKINTKTDAAKLIEYTLAEAEITTPDGNPYTSKKIREKIPVLKP